MEVKLHQILYLYDVFLENMDSDNCYEVLKENFNTMFGVNVRYYCNDISLNSFSINLAQSSESIFSRKTS